MVLGAAAGGLMSLGLALPTGWMFGYGYGHGVRSGYNAFKPSKNNAVNQLHLSSNPVQGAQGAGLLSAEHMMQKQEQQPLIRNMGLTSEPSIKQASDVIESPPTSPKIPLKQGNQPNPELFYTSKDGKYTIEKSKIRSHEDYVNFIKYGKYPNSNKSGWY